MQRITVLLLAILLLSTTGCAIAQSPVGIGVFYTNVKGPIGSDAMAAESRTGEACASNILGVVASGDASIATAKSNGGITKVATVDHETFTMLGMYARFCTRVRGE